MSVITNNLLLGDDGYNISRSVRLRSSASAYFNRTLTTPTNNKIFTWSGWVKRGLLGSGLSYPNLFGTSSDELLFYSATYTDELALNMAAGAQCNVVVSQVFRDPSAWYHIIVAVDTTQATAANRVKIYVNGVQVTAFAVASYPSLNYNPSFNSATAHALGNNSGATRPFDGYLTEVNFIDGQALTPSSFGETDVLTGVWKPKKYAGTYGTNGFYLNFSDNSAATAAAIGKDNSGNGNNWTPNNISVTAGVTYDSMLDVPTMWADGGNGRGNYCTLNPLNKNASSITVLNGNLGISTSASNVGVAGTIGVSSGKWYWETTFTNASGVPSIGAASATWDKSYVGYTGSIGYHGNGVIYNNGTNVQSGLASYTSGDVIGVALDLDAGSIKFYKNNTQQGTTITGLTGEWFPAVAGQTSSTLAVNFGQRPFSYTPPTGFKALNTQNLPDATIKKGNQYFDVSLFTGTSGNVTISGLGFQPDFIWAKARSNAQGHNQVDSVRGANKLLQSNLTNAESTLTTPPTFNSDGWTSTTDIHTNGYTYAAWQWKESVSAGFDIVTFTAASSGNFTVNHSLGVTPAMLIVKTRDTAGWNWHVWHKSLSSATNSALILNSTAAVNSSFNMWGASGVSSTNFGVTAGNPVAANSACVAYLFAEVAGYSKFGSYTGNGSTDGTFVYLGFRPRFILIKSSSAVQGWHIVDTARDTYNLAGQGLDPNTSSAEYTPASSGYPLDILSNGFKHRYASEPNVSGATYIYAAFAENPTKYSLAR